MIFNYLNLNYYHSSCFFCCFYFGVSDPANIQVQIHEWCIHFSFVVILSPAYTCCFEFFHSFFHPGKAFNCPTSQLYQNLSCKDTSATQIARFNGQFSFLNLLEPSALCDVVDYFLLLQTILFEFFVFLLPR